MNPLARPRTSCGDSWRTGISQWSGAWFRGPLAFSKPSLYLVYCFRSIGGVIGTGMLVVDVIILCIDLPYLAFRSFCKPAQHRHWFQAKPKVLCVAWDCNFIGKRWTHWSVARIRHCGFHLLCGHGVSWWNGMKAKMCKYFKVIAKTLGKVAYLPIPGGHITLAERFVDPAFSFTLGWNYWYNWTVCNELLYTDISRNWLYHSRLACKLLRKYFNSFIVNLTKPKTRLVWIGLAVRHLIT